MSKLQSHLILGLTWIVTVSVLVLAPSTARATARSESQSAYENKNVVCDPGGKPPHYSFWGKKSIYIRARDGRIYGQSGVTLSISKGVSKTIGGSVTGTGTAEVKAIFAKASVSLAISVQYSRTTTTTFGGSWTVPKSQRVGWLEVGTRSGYTFKWKRYHYRSPCRVVVDARGIAKGPKKSAALMFRHS
jgi:hypothetical protein